jgi:hypothetical protein
MFFFLATVTILLMVHLMSWSDYRIEYDPKTGHSLGSISGHGIKLTTEILLSIPSLLIAVAVVARDGIAPQQRPWGYGILAFQAFFWLLVSLQLFFRQTGS